MKKQTIGVEIEFTGIAREKALEAIGKYFGNAPYGDHHVKDAQKRDWTVMRDGSIRPEKKNRSGEIVRADDSYRCELVTPILKWEDLETLKGVVNAVKAAGGFVNETCGLHVHIGASEFTAQGLRNLVNITGSREELFYKMFATQEWRKRYCRPTNRRVIAELNGEKPSKIEDVKRIWYNGNDGSGYHYDDSRYTICNLHAFFSKGTIEFRIFNSTLEADEVITAVHFSAAIVNFAKKVSRTTYTIETAGAFKSDLKRATSWLMTIGLRGEEFKTTRQYLLKNLKNTNVSTAVA